MNEITKVVLENEMDLILAHKQSMRLAELTGLTLSAQTTFATAVSEVSRYAIGPENAASITLYVSDKKEKLKYITAVLSDRRPGFSEAKDDGYKYAKRLVQNINVTSSGGENRIELHYRLPPGTRIDDTMIEKWRINLNTDPAISPYEEIKRKNSQLIEMANKLRESEYQYKSLTNSLPIMIYTISVEEGGITYANEWLYNYTGKTIAEINESKWACVFHPDDLDRARADWQKKAADGRDFITTEGRLKSVKDNDYRWHTGISTAIKNDEGEVISWNTFMVDIHAQKMIEQTLKDNVQLKEIHAELEEKVTLLNQSNQRLEQFAYIASHDLQEPLRKIGFYSDFLKSKFGHQLPEEAGMFFDNLINATDRMKALIQDVLTYSTVRKDEFTLVDLNHVAAETVLDLEISIKEKQALIRTASLPAIEGNVRQLKQLFENLISNSLKFSEPGRAPVISITAELANDNVELRFTDNGIGFEEKYINKMFNLFQRLHTRDKYTGTGIGLTICKKIVELHSGHISATGVPGKGAIFSITLPVKQVDAK